MTRDSWSRPSSSVPNQCSIDGLAVVSVRSWNLGSCGAISGAKIARTNTIATIRSPTTASLLRKKRRRMSPNWVWPRIPYAAAATSSPAGAASSMTWALSLTWSLQPDAGVEVGVGQVDDQVHDDERPDAVG